INLFLQIIETENMMDRIVTGLSESSVKTFTKCLHSLSRSVQQLRTSFQDHAVWKPLMKVLQNAPDEILVVASSMLCNLLLEFSPSKENMAFQAEQKIKADILRSLSTEQLFRLLSDSDLNVLMKTLGLLRNLLSTRPHIDKIMSTHGKQIMQAVTLILEGEHNIEVKEQTLCILANIADGTTAKELIMTNDDILQKIKYYMNLTMTLSVVHGEINPAAESRMDCRKEGQEEERPVKMLLGNPSTKAFGYIEEGSQERQDKLRDMGIVDILHKLSQSPDSNLCDKAKMALQQYLA
ncbi:Armadillo repeat-containing protein 8, partial [Camelus dromedarius]